MSTPNDVMESALASANAQTAEVAGVDADAEKQEKEQVQHWLSTIEKCRDFDKQAYAEMATCRGYAAGLSAHEVSVNIIGSNIDTMKPSLYAKNPDVSVAPARQTSMPMTPRPIPPGPPPVDPTATLMQLPAMGIVGQNPDAMAAAMADPTVQEKLAPEVIKYQQEFAKHQQDTARYAQEMAAYAAEMRERAMARDERKRFSETLELLISRAWQLAELKEEVRATIGGALTTAVGWFKGTWQEDAGLDPITVKQLNSLQTNIARIDELRKQAADPTSTPALDQLRQQIVEEQTALDAAKEVITARGLVVDYIYSEDMTVPIGVTRITKTSSMPWLAHRSFMSVMAAKAMFPDVPTECWKKAKKYSQRKPRVRIMVDIDNHPSWGTATADQASQFSQSSDGTTAEFNEAQTGDFLCFHEIWDKEGGVVRLVCEGLDRYPRPPAAPEVPVTRFYPFYPIAPVEADGQRYPQSLVQRSYGLQDERNGRLSALKKARNRSLQGILGNSSMISKDDAGKIVQSEIGEITLIEGIDNTPIQNIFMEKPTIRLDPALYETETIDRNIERIWGIQQAMQGAVRVEQTATESEIQNQGFSTRTAFMREPLENALGEFANATAEMLLQRLTFEDAVEYAGPGAVWPEAATVSDLASLVTVSIKAGSTGKPNLSAERNAWAQTMPLMMELIEKVGGMRGASPADVADKLENLADITLQLSGSSMSAEDMMPAEAMPMDAMMQPDPSGGMAPPEVTAPPTNDFATGPAGPMNPNPAA